jgi:hypothetical protein
VFSPPRLPQEGLSAARAWCAQFLQTEAELVEGVRGVVAAAAAANCVHLELRLCPHAHTAGGLSPQAVVAAAASGFAAGARGTALRGGLLLSVRASGDEATGHEAVLLAAQWAGKGVLGVELAAEADPPAARELASWRAVARSAAAADVALTCHVSDEGCAGPPASPAAAAAQRAAANAAWAVQLGAQRLSGGLAAFARDALLSQSVAQAGLTLELCLSDSVRPGAPGWPGSYGEHPVRALAAVAGAVTLNLAPCVGHALLSGGEGAWGAEPAAELAHLVRHCGLGWRGARGMMLAASLGAFLGPARNNASPADQRRRFAADFEKKLDAALAASGAFASEAANGDESADGASPNKGGKVPVYDSRPGWAAEGEGAPALLGGALLPRSSARAARVAAERDAAGLLPPRPHSPPAAPGRPVPAPIAERAARAAASMPTPRSGEEAQRLPAAPMPSWAEAFAARPVYAPPEPEKPRTAALPPAPPPPAPPPLMAAGGVEEQRAALRAPAVATAAQPQRAPAMSLPPAVAPLKLPPLEEALATMGLGGSTAQAAWDSAGAAAASAAVAAIAAASAALGRPVVPAAPQWQSPVVPRAVGTAMPQPQALAPLSMPPPPPGSGVARPLAFGAPAKAPTSPQSPMAAVAASIRAAAFAPPTSSFTDAFGPSGSGPQPVAGTAAPALAPLPYAPRASSALEAASLGAARALEQASAAVEAANAAMVAAAASALPPQYVPRSYSHAGAATPTAAQPPDAAAAAVSAAREAIAALRAASLATPGVPDAPVAGVANGRPAARVASAEAMGAAAAALASARAAAVAHGAPGPRRAAVPDPGGLGLPARGGRATSPSRDFRDGEPSYGRGDEPDLGDEIEAELADYEAEDDAEEASPAARPKSAGGHRPGFRDGAF